MTAVLQYFATRNGKVMKLLTKLSIENLMHPFQTFILGQKNLAQRGSNMIFHLSFTVKMKQNNINPIADMTSLRDKTFFSYNNLDELYLGGVLFKNFTKI